MDKETYEALKTCILALNLTNDEDISEGLRESIKQIEGWIDEVSKEY